MPRCAGVRRGTSPAVGEHLAAVRDEVFAPTLRAAPEPSPEPPTEPAITTTTTTGARMSAKTASILGTEAFLGVLWVACGSISSAGRRLLDRVSILPTGASAIRFLPRRW